AGWSNGVESSRLQQRSQTADQPHVRWRLCFWQDARENHHGRGAGAQNRRAQEATNGMDGVASRPPPWVHFLGTVRTQPSDDCGKRPYEITHATQGGSWWKSLAQRPASMSALRTDVAGLIRWRSTSGCSVSLQGSARQPRRGLVYLVWQLANRSGGRAGTAGRDWWERSRSGPGSGGADARTTETAAQRAGVGAGAGPL